MDGKTYQIRGLKTDAGWKAAVFLDEERLCADVVSDIDTVQDARLTTFLAMIETEFRAGRLPR